MDSMTYISCLFGEDFQQNLVFCVPSSFLGKVKPHPQKNDRTLHYFVSRTLNYLQLPY